MRALFAIVALCLAILLAMGAEWAVRHFVDSTPVNLVSRDPRLSFQHSAHLARDAVVAFRALSIEEQRALRAALADALWSLDRWASAINATSLDMLCVGERHRAEVRQFLAQRLLPLLRFDVVMLEGSQPQIQSALRAHAAGEPVPLMLGAPLAPLLDALSLHHGRTQVIGVDESEDERRARRALARADLARRAREDTIVSNLRRRWMPGARHLVLFGALHCRDLPQWFFARLPREFDQLERDRASNTVVLARYQEPAVQVLMYLLDEIGLGSDTLVVPDTAAFPDLVLTWIPNVADAFATYESAVLFDERALATVR